MHRRRHWHSAISRSGRSVSRAFYTPFYSARKPFGPGAKAQSHARSPVGSDFLQRIPGVPSFDKPRRGLDCSPQRSKQKKKSWMVPSDKNLQSIECLPTMVTGLAWESSCSGSPLLRLLKFQPSNQPLGHPTRFIHSLSSSFLGIPLDFDYINTKKSKV